MGLCVIVQYHHDTSKKGEDKSHHIMTHILKTMAVLTPTLVLLQDAAWLCSSCAVGWGSIYHHRTHGRQIVWFGGFASVLDRLKT